ncbi:MAG: HEAT repeat domain-containing protein [Proteobacteria bacterium]|nr:HEAT repeat domain-containing protein [Pseudomonadota bacterium]
MIMAIGECKYREALPFLEELSGRKFEATMVYLALGDALLRLSFRHENDVSRALEFMDGDNPMLIDGALRAIAVLRMLPKENEIKSMVAFARALSLDDGRRFWVAAAAAGWVMPEVREFLSECAESPRQDLQEAAEYSLAGKYKNWHPL